MPDISVDDATPFVVLKSTDNIPIELSWHLFTNYVGLNKQIQALEGRPTQLPPFREQALARYG
jgi:hypothetical protein